MADLPPEINYFPTILSERKLFYERKQRENEDILTYLNELKRLAMTCAFNAFYFEAMRDRFVLGLRHESIKRTLLYTKDLDLAQAENIAMSFYINENTLASTDGHSISSQGVNSSAQPSTSDESSMTGTLPQVYDDLPYVNDHIIPNSNPQPLTIQHDAKQSVALSTSYLTSVPGTSHESMPQTKRKSMSGTSQELNPGTSRVLMPETSREFMPATSQVEYYDISEEEGCSNASNSQPGTPIKQEISNGKIVPHFSTPLKPLLYPSPIKSEGGISCPYCPKQFPSPSLLERHKVTHTKKKNFPCSKCRKYFASQGSRDNHQYSCKKKLTPSNGGATNH